MTNSTFKKIALFGGSFNPPHLGHLKVLEQILKKDLWHEVWLLPVFQHPFAKALVSFEHRLNMLKILKQKIGDARLKISTIEKELNCNPSYTYTTVVALQKKYPDCKFSVFVGSDVKNELHKWFEYEKLRKLVEFEFIPRKGFEKSDLPKVSSTEIREAIKNGKPIDNMTLKAIAEYIQNHQLYQ